MHGGICPVHDEVLSVAERAGLSSVTRHRYSTLDSWSVISNCTTSTRYQLIVAEKYIRDQETYPLTLLFSLCPNYLLVLLTDDDDDDSDVDE